MIELQGKYSKDCKIFCDNPDETVISQVINILNHEMFDSQSIRIMPDCHAGTGCVIGFTAPINDKICPNLIGVDIGCGMTTLIIKARDNDIAFAAELDSYIRQCIPSGHNVNKSFAFKLHLLDEKEMEDIAERTNQELDYIKASLGSLGGGNHFIECGRLDRQHYALTVHSGSRNFGLKIAQYHQKIAQERTLGKGYSKELCWLEGEYANQYLVDMRFAQKYASINRMVMLQRLVDKMKLNVVDKIESIHNFIGEDNIIRKGAISAKKGERVIIPWNMRDGLILGIGRGNEDWNNSAPHGAGRVLSRSQAKQKLDVEVFKNTMEGIYSTCIGKSTLDESPMAYKSYKEIEKYLSETVEITNRIKPFYNFKAS